MAILISQLVWLPAVLTSSKGYVADPRSAWQNCFTYIRVWLQPFPHQTYTHHSHNECIPTDSKTFRSSILCCDPLHHQSGLPVQASCCIPCDYVSDCNAVWVSFHAVSVPAEPFGGHPGPPCLLSAAKGPEDIAAESAPAVHQCPSSSSLPGKSAPGTPACCTQCFMHKRQKRLAGCFYAN